MTGEPKWEPEIVRVNLDDLIKRYLMTERNFTGMKMHCIDVYKRRAPNVKSEYVLVLMFLAIEY